MSLTATLAIDIEVFKEGLEKATVSLKSFERAAENTDRDLSRLLESFTGQKVAIEADKMAEAVRRIGGASNLTEKEQRRVNATVSEAIEKYRALGENVPPYLLSLQKETAQAARQTSILSQGVQALIAAFSARAVLRMAGDVLELTGKLTDLSGKTGIGVESLQRLNFVTSQSGVGLEEIAQGAVKLGKALVGGDKAAVTAVQALHLNVSELIAAGPERAFLAIGEAIAKVPNPMERSALAVALFGRSGADFLPAFTTNMSELADQAQRTGSVLSADMVEAGNKAGDALDRLQLVGAALFARVFIPLMPAIEGAANLLGTVLPAALSAAHDGIDFLLRKGFELQAWLADLAVSVAQTVRDVPVLGRVFGQSSADIDELKRNAQFARDALNSFNAQGVKPAKESVQQAIPLVTKFGEEMQSAGRKAKKSGEDIGIVWGDVGNIVRFQIAGVLSDALEDFETDTNNATAAMEELRMELARVAGTAIEIRQPLANTMDVWRHGFTELRTTVYETEPEVQGFFSRVFSGADGLGRRIPDIFQRAFEGGGGALGAVKSFATQAISILVDMLPSIEDIGQQMGDGFVGPIQGALSKLQVAALAAGSTAAAALGGATQGSLGATVGGLASGIGGAALAASGLGTALAGAGVAGTIALGAMTFGLGAAAVGVVALVRHWSGLSGEVRNGRAMVAQFEDAIISTISESGRAAAGTERWAQFVHSLTEKYAAVGRTAEEALTDAKRLWDSSAEGGEETWRVVDEVNRKMQEQVDAAVAGADEITAAIGRIPRNVDININGHYNAPGDMPEGEGYYSGTLGVHGSYFRNFGRGTPAMLHGNEAVVRQDQAVPFAQQVMAASARPMAPARSARAKADPLVPQLLAAIRSLPMDIKLSMREALVMAK